MPPPPQQQHVLEGAAAGARQATERQGLGSKRYSRGLWDAVLRPPTTASRLFWWSSLFRAILYEVQPIRYSEGVVLSRSVTTTTGATLQWIFKQLQSLPGYLVAFWSLLQQHMTLRRSGILAGCVGYYWIVRYLHEWLEAGPMVLIITAMVGIFTVGLRDDDDRQGLSAYSVFNRGFQRIMGSIDAEELLQQHVGAAGGGGGLMALAMAPALRQPQVGDVHGRREAVQENRNDPPQQQQQQQQRGVPDRGGARKSGKKARRQNLEQRRELRRQREAAMAMGFGDENNELQELLAMQRLMEEEDRGIAD